MNKSAENLLAPFGWIFEQIARMRRTLYEKNRFESQDLGAFVVSVGNLTVGGTGKTPLVALVGKMLAAKHHRVCVLTRGYKRRNPNERILVSDGKKILADAADAGDEPFELAHKLLNFAAVIADKNRIDAGLWARENWGTTAFVLDDGLQHLRVKRDVEIIVVDAMNPFGNEKLLPAGILREPVSVLQKADCVIITRADLVDDVDALKTKIANFTDCPILLAENRITDFVPFRKFPAAENRQPRKKIQQSVFAFCALGNPANFFESLRRENLIVKATKAFPDHHQYQPKDITDIAAEAAKSGAEVFMTTAKDAVKLKNLKFNLPVFVVEIEVVLTNAAALYQVISRK